MEPAGKSSSDLLREMIHSADFSGVVAVELTGQPWLEFAGGFANRSTGEANGPETRFATASVTKMFTAVCLGRLVDAGLCRFDQPLSDLVPDLRSHFGSEITLVDLLSHRSGLGDYIDDDAELPYAGFEVERLDCPRAFLPYVVRAPRHSPGKFRYSSAGYILLGLAIEALTGLSYPAAVARWVCEPAQLVATHFPPLDVPQTGLAVGHLPDGRENFQHVPKIGGPDGGIVTTVADLRKFFRVLTSGDLLSPAIRQELWNSVRSPVGAAEYGLGFYINSIAGQTWYGHTGSDPGVSARVAFSADGRSSIVVLCNVNAVAFRVFRQVVACLYVGQGPRP